jgi:Ca2+-binding EF-hand superfamily protein
LVLILDENMEGNISLDEYYSYIGFQQRAIFKLLEILDEKGISYQELFNMCDSSRDGLISVSELQQVLLGLSAEFY